MKMTGPIGATPFDTAPHGIIGAPMDRVDGRLKVTGAARYAYEVTEPQNPLYAYMLPATIAKGQITGIDTGAAEASPGVRLVVTYKNAPKQSGGQHRQYAAQLTGPDILHWGQPVALVVADTFEQARAGAYLIRVAYDRQDPRTSLHDTTVQPATPQGGQNPPDTAVGQFLPAFTAAPVQIDVTYTTPIQSHAMMEPHATIAQWNGDELVLWTSNQMLSQGKGAVARTLQMPEGKVRLVSRFIGGGFGAKLWVCADAILAAIAARMAGRPVKLALARPQIFAATTSRSDTVQRLRLGTDPEGRILAIGHDVLSGNLAMREGFEGAANQTRTLYAGPNRQTRHRLAVLDRPIASAMRAPGEAVGMLALECAMDELAEKLGLDPVELRIRNEPTEDPEQHVPYSVRNLVPCLREGAIRFGWNRRNPKPGQVEAGPLLIGMGMAASIRGNPLQPSSARVRLGGDGVLTVQTAMTDLGTGTYTILTQIAAELMGLDPGQVRIEIGDSSLPKASGSGGSFGAGSCGSAVYDACMQLRAKLAQAAGIDPDSARFAGGFVSGGGTVRPVRELAGAGMEADGQIEPGDMRKQYSQQAYGAQFAEVAVDRDTGEIRLRRMLGVFTAGRILNPKTARSQAIGGMIFGLGAALSEELVIDPRTGHFVNNNLAEYHVPVHADVPQLDAVFLPELDDKSNPLKSKGIGELGISGAGAAVANAVYNACGVRIRDYPLTLDKVLMGMESRA